MSLKAKVDKDGVKTTIEGKNLIDIVEQVVNNPDQGRVTMVQIIRDEESSLENKEVE